MSASRRGTSSRKTSTTLDKIQAMEKQRLERRQQMEERKQEMKEEEKRNAELGVVGDVDFVRMIGDWRLGQPDAEDHVAFDCDAGGRAKGKELCICVRKRPIGKREIAANDHDAVSCLNPAVVVHDCKHKVDGITKYLNNAKFVFDHAFSENVQTEEVYECVGAPLVDFVVRRKGRATVFAYGQTGSGKTYTMEGIQRRAARDIFLRANASDAEGTNPAQENDFQIVGVSFFEIYGGRCQDLLRDRARLQVREDGKGEVNVVDLAEERVQNADELLDAIERGNRLRTTQRTQANDASSRSHAVCQIVLRTADDEVAGKLSLVDLAGSERGADTKSHSRQLRTESAEINKSLLALKECIRGLATNDTHVPFRASKLTMVLRDSFVRPHCRVAMIATVSPSVSATDHTINTLRYADRVKEKPSNTVSTPSSRSGNNNNENNAPLSSNQGAAVSSSMSPCEIVTSTPGGSSKSSSSSPAVVVIAHQQKPQQATPRRSLEAARRSLDSRQGGRRGSSSSVRGTSSTATKPPAAASVSPAPRSPRAGLVDSSLENVPSSAKAPSLVPGWPPAETASSKQQQKQRDPVVLVADRVLSGPNKKNNKSAKSSAPDAAQSSSSQQHDEDLRLLQRSIGDRHKPSAGENHDDDVDPASVAELHRTVDSLYEEEEGLLTAHMNVIQENAELLTEEGRMLQQVQDESDYDIDAYVARLTVILDTKDEQIKSLRQRLQRFNDKLKEEEDRSKQVRRMPMF